MEKSWRSIIMLLMVLLVVGVLGSCKKDPQKDNGVKYVPISCTIDIHGSDRDGLSVMTMGSGFSLTSNNTQLYVQECETPQLLIVADENGHVRMMYRGIVNEGQSIEINAHTTVLALVTCNPIVAMIGDSNYATMIECIEALPSYTQFESEVQSAIASGKDILDTTNIRLQQSLQQLYLELLGPIPIDSKAKSAPSWVDCEPLEFQWTNPNVPGGSFTLRNYSICPTYYGTITSKSQKRDLVIPSKGSYSISGIMTNIFFLEDFLHGNAVKVDLSPNEDNTIELTNMHDPRAVAEIGTNFVNDILEIVKLPLPDNLLKEITTEAGKMIADAVIEAEHNEGNTLSIISKSIAHSVKEYVIGKGYHFLFNSPGLFATFDGDAMWGTKWLNITKRIFNICNFGESTINIGTRIFFLLYYPNDISFCIHYTTDGDRIITRPCGGRTEPLNGLFSVSTTKQVRFSPGNLEIGGRSFTSHQYDYGGYFAWGTGNYPDNPSTDWQAYTTFYDWGDYIEGNWRTLSNSEWSYLFNTRQNASDKYGYGTINGIKGIFILPDNWTLPSGCTFTSGHISSEENWYLNSYSVSQWELMEASGAVFFPAACTYYQDCDEGFYWSSTPCSAPWTAWAYSLWFSPHSINSTTSGSDRNARISVRLVWDNN